MYSLQPNSQDLLSYLPIQQGVAVPSLWKGGDLPSLNILNRGKWQETPFTAGLSCNQVPQVFVFLLLTFLLAL